MQPDPARGASSSNRGAVLVRGTALRSILSGIERISGAEGLATVVAAVPRHVRDRIDGSGPLPTLDYPIDTSATLHLAIRDTIGHGTWLLNHKVGIAAARVDFGGVYRAVLWALDYESLFSRMGRTWNRYLSHGSVRYDLRRDGITIDVEDVGGFNQGMWASIAGRVEGLLAMRSAKGVHSQVTHFTEATCRIDARWQP